MSGINCPASQGRLVVTVKPATMPSVSHGRPPRPLTRMVTVNSQAISAHCRITQGQKARGMPALRNSPYSAERPGSGVPVMATVR